MSKTHIEACRSSQLEVFCKKSVLRNFTKFTGKHLCQSLFLIKLQARRFPADFVKFLRTAFYTEQLWWLVLDVSTVLFLLVFNVQSTSARRESEF